MCSRNNLVILIAIFIWNLYANIERRNKVVLIETALMKKFELDGVIPVSN